MKLNKKMIEIVVLRISLFLVAIIALALLAAPRIVDMIMFPAPTPSYDWSMQGVVNVGWEESPVAAYWVENSDSQKVILYSYGNGEDIGIDKQFFHFLSTAGCSVFAYDYPGYGLTAGKPSEQGVYAASEAAYRFLVEQKNIAPADIVVMGRSLGGGPACYLAEKFPVGALILESTFTSAPRVKTGIRILPYDPFPNIVRIKNITCPKLIIHGTRDETVPFSHAKKLAAAAPQPCRLAVFEGSGHDDILIDAQGQETFIALIREFLESGGR